MNNADRTNQLYTKLLNLHGRRVTNAGEAVNDNDYVTLGQLNKAIQGLTVANLLGLLNQSLRFNRKDDRVSTTEQTTALQGNGQEATPIYDIRDINRPSADNVGAVRVSRVINLNLRLVVGWDDSIGGVGGGYLQSANEGTGGRPLALNPNGGEVLIGADLTVGDDLVVTDALTVGGLVTLSNLTASRPVHTNASKQLISALVDLTNANHVDASPLTAGQPIVRSGGVFASAAGVDKNSNFVTSVTDNLTTLQYKDHAGVNQTLNVMISTTAPTEAANFTKGIRTT